MALNFPNNPATGDRYTAEGVTYEFFDNRWVIYGGAGGGGSFQFPVGYVYISTSQDNPSTVFGYGVWTEISQGRVLVGVGSNGENTWAAGEERGSETHALTAGENGPHTHNYQDTGTGVTGGGVFPSTGGFALTESTRQTVNSGSGTPHNNVQPSLAVYMYERVS